MLKPIEGYNLRLYGPVSLNFHNKRSEICVGYMRAASHEHKFTSHRWQQRSVPTLLPGHPVVIVRPAEAGQMESTEVNNVLNVAAAINRHNTIIG